MFRKSLAPLVVLSLIVAAPAAQNTERIDLDVNARIRKEGMENSQIPKTMHYLTDVHGPRLTGSPNHENAAKWAVKQMETWGFKNGKLEPFDFGTIANSKVVREGWLNEKASGHIISPVKDNLVFEVLAWTPSTKGTVTAEAIHIVAPQGPIVEAPAPATAPPAAGAAGDVSAALAALAAQAGGRGGGRGGVQRLGPTEDDMKAYFASLQPKIKGAIVLMGGMAAGTVNEIGRAHV